MNIKEELKSTRQDFTKIPMPQNELNFGDFSQMPEYIAVNSSLIQKLSSRLPSPFIHVDVAAGTGMVEQLIKENAEATGKEGLIIGVDPNATSLAIARENVVSSETVSIEFIRGMGQHLKQLLNGEIPEEGVNSTSIHDALHEIWKEEDKVQIIQSMSSILKPGGFLSFNSAFTTIANGPDWGKWKLFSMRELSGNEKIKRNRGCESMPVLSPEDYKAMIENAGLKVVHEEITPVFLTKAALVAIAKYPAFFQGLFDDMPGQENYSDIEKSEALIRALERVNDSDGSPSSGFDKNWYEIIAQKPL